jgi:hypothetical protein
MILYNELSQAQQEMLLSFNKQTSMAYLNPSDKTVQTLVALELIERVNILRSERVYSFQLYHLTALGFRIRARLLELRGLNKPTLNYRKIYKISDNMYSDLRSFRSPDEVLRVNLKKPGFKALLSRELIERVPETDSNPNRYATVFSAPCKLTDAGWKAVEQRRAEAVAYLQEVFLSRQSPYSPYLRLANNYD